MAKLVNWYMIQDHEHGYRLAGNVNGHVKMEDGTFIFTTPIIDMVREGEKFRVNTRNTEYSIVLNEMKVGCRLQLTEEIIREEKSAAAYYFILTGILTGFFRDENEKEFTAEDETRYQKYLRYLGEEAISELQQMITLKRKEIKEGVEAVHLQNREIYMELNTQNKGYFTNGFYKLNDEENILEEPLVQNGMSQDSVLFVDDKKKYDFRCFMLHKKLKVYHWWGIMTKIYFKNTGIDHIEIDWGKENLVIEPGQMKCLDLC